MVRVILLFSIIFVFSCTPTKQLKDGTKVPANKFGNINKFDPSILNLLDINHFYNKVDYYMADKNYNKIRDIGNDVERKIQFYNNGRVRFFSFSYIDADPERTGRRGVIYKINNKIKLDYQSADQDGRIFISSYTVKVDNDLIYLLENNNAFLDSEFICTVYRKSEEIPEDWNQYIADW